jgi:glutamine cyclotransferase
VEALVDLSKLREHVTQHVDLDVLNGIAYNKRSNTFFVTGKNWYKMIEIKLTQ